MRHTGGIDGLDDTGRVEHRSDGPAYVRRSVFCARAKHIADTSLMNGIALEVCQRQWEYIRSFGRLRISEFQPKA